MRTDIRKRILDRDFPLERVIMLLALPVMGQMLLDTLTQIVDMAMVGRLGASAIAAVGFSIRPNFVVMTFFIGLGIAATALVARSIGEKNQERANDVVRHALLVGIVIGLILTAVMYFGAREILKFLKPADDVLDLAEGYLQYVALGLPFTTLGMVITSCLRGSGDMKTAFYVGIGSNLLNVFLNYVLIFGHFGFPEMGVRGAALATSLSKVFGFIVLFYVLLRGWGGVQLSLAKAFHLDGRILTSFLKIGVPASLEKLAQSITVLLVTRMLATLGTVILATMTVLGSIEQLSFLQTLAFSSAATTLVGQNLGAKQIDRAEDSFKKTMRVGTIFMTVMGLLFIIFPKLFLGIFTDDAAMLEVGVKLLPITGLMQIPQTLTFILSGALRGAGDTKSAFLASIIGNFAFRLVGSYIVLEVFGLGIVAYFAVMLLDIIFRNIFLYWRFKQGKWRDIKII